MLRRFRKRRGIGYCSYLFFDHFLPSLQYVIYYRLRFPYLKAMVTAICLLIASLVCAYFYGIPGAVAPAVVFLICAALMRRIRDGRTQQRAEVLFFQAQLNQKAEDFLLQIDPPSTGDVAIVEARPLARDAYRSRRAFLRQWHNLSLMENIINVPTLLSVDYKNNALYRSFIAGETIGKLFAENNAKFNYLPDEVLCELEEQMNRMHQEGIAGMGDALQNVVIRVKDSSPWFVDLSTAKYYPSRKSFAFLYARDQDRIKFNRLFNTDLITETSARIEVQTWMNRRCEWYVPVDFGQGLTVGHFWAVDNGTGRWEYFNRKVLEPLVRDKRILDLGSSNAIMDLMMLKAGAREVIGFESSRRCAEAARIMQRLFEWRDNQKYQLIIRNCRITEILSCDPGPLDLITAFGSLDHLNHEELGAVLQRAAVLSPLLVLQANLGKSGNQQSGVEYLRHLLQTNGFPYVRIYATPGFARPLLVARKEPERTSHSIEASLFYGEPLLV